jgi:hypothetical protein
MTLMNGVVVESPLQDDAVGEGAKAAMGSCAGLQEERFRALDVS